MRFKILPITIAYQDSPRGRAYLNAFLKYGLSPQEVVVMESGFEFPDGFSVEVEKYGYKDVYYNPDITLEDIADRGTIVSRVMSSSINDPQLVEQLSSSESEYILFTGGGIVSPVTLSIAKEFIHIHPGYVPYYRGSTCFYYSLIEEYELGATAFFMAEQLDSGPIIRRDKYNINVLLNRDQKCFIDYILDPYIRMCTLENVLLKLAEGENLLNSSEQHIEPCDKEAYFVAHPVLRAKACEIINNNYDESKPTGITVLN